MQSSSNFPEGVVFITGAAGGIGAACVETFYHRNYRVIATDTDLSQLERLTKKFDRQRIALFAVDVTDVKSVEMAVRQGANQWGPLTAAINVAGIGGPHESVDKIDPKDFQSVVAVNLAGVFHSLQAESRSMLQGKGGSIVNISSVLGSTAIPHASAYIAAKHGVEGLTKAAAMDFATMGVRVNSIAPGFVSTPLLLGRRTEIELEAIANAHPMGRLGTSKEVADLAHFLCSDHATFITGTTLPVDGGLLSGRRL